MTANAPPPGNRGCDVAPARGYVHGEATQFIEFCVELDNQDERLTPPYDPSLDAQIDPKVWSRVFDSRQAVAEGFVEWLRLGEPPYEEGGQAPDDDLRYWANLFTEIQERALQDDRNTGVWGAIQHQIQSREANAWDAAGAQALIPLVARNPNLNGFGPWQNAWLLYRGSEAGPFSGKYVIAIRGTVFSNAPSAIEDAIFQPVVARRFLSASVSFAETDAATLHGGFAHASFTLLLDRRFGILQALHDRVPDGAALYIVGHSQGAAMATIVHAFFDNAMRHAQADSYDPLAMKDRHYRLKSYAFAQPKPGNYAFASDFARATQPLDNAIVINNDIDPVPKVPLTLEATEDLATNLSGHSWWTRGLHFVSGMGAGLRGTISAVAEPFVRKSAEHYGHFYRYDEIRPVAGNEETGSSWDFVPAGRVILVFGTAHKARAGDVFFQHHATTYRDLIRTDLPQMGADPDDAAE